MHFRIFFFTAEPFLRLTTYWGSHTTGVTFCAALSTPSPNNCHVNIWGQVPLFGALFKH